MIFGNHFWDTISKMYNSESKYFSNIPRKIWMNLIKNILRLRLMTCGTPDDLQFEFPFYSESRPGFINNFIASSLIKFLYLHIKCEALIARLSALSKSIRQNSDRKMNTLIRLTLPNNLNLSRNGTFEFYPEYNYQVALIHYLSCITFKFSLGHIFQ